MVARLFRQTWLWFVYWRLYPALASAAAGSPRDRAAARAGYALEYPVPSTPTRDRDPGCPASAQAILTLSVRQAGRRNGTGIGPGLRQSSRSRGSRGHRQLAPIPRTWFGVPSERRFRGPGRRGARQRYPRRGSQAHPGIPRDPPLPYRSAGRWSATRLDYAAWTDGRQRPERRSRGLLSHGAAQDKGGEGFRFPFLRRAVCAAAENQLDECLVDVRR